MRLRFMLAAAAALATSPAAAQYTAGAGLWGPQTTAPAAAPAQQAGRFFQAAPPNTQTATPNPQTAAGYAAANWGGAPYQQPRPQVPAAFASTETPTPAAPYQSWAPQSLHSRCDGCNPVPGISVGLCATCQGGSAAPVDQVYSGYDQGPVLSSGDGYCGPAVGCAPRRRWFASVSGLVMSRDRPNKLWTSWESSQSAYQPFLVMHAPAAETMGGGEVTIGRYLGCQSRLAASYWILDRSETQHTFNAGRLGGDTISSTFDEFAPTITFNDGRTLDSYTDNSQSHRIRRVNEFHNVELNFLNGSLSCLGGCGLGCGTDACGVGCGPDACGTCGGGFRSDFLVGARFLRFDENLAFSALAGGATWGQNGGDDEATIEQDVVNNLIGFQIGSDMSYFIGSNFSLFARPKVGVYANVIDTNPRIYKGTGEIGFDRNYTKNDVAAMGELDLGGRLCFGNRFAVFGGYRLLGIAGVALADENMPRFVAQQAQWGEIYSNGSLLLHGAFAGGEVLF